MCEHAAVMFSSDEIEKRKAVWLALSELFLDTDVSSSYEYIASECAASTFSPDELEQILIQEVMPVCGWNLLSVAGAWSGFDEQWLLERIVDHKKLLRKRLAGWVFGRIFRRDLHNHWQAIVPMIDLARTKQA